MLQTLARSLALACFPYQHHAVAVVVVRIQSIRYRTVRASFALFDWGRADGPKASRWARSPNPPSCSPTWFEHREKDLRQSACAVDQDHPGR